MTQISMKLLTDSKQGSLYIDAVGGRAQALGYKLFAGFDPEFGSVEVIITLREADYEVS